MQRYLNELCLACKEQNYNCHSCKICTIFNFLKIRWKRTKKSHLHGPFLSHHRRNQRELVIHALAVGRTLQYRSVRMVNHDPDRGLPKQLFGRHHLLWRLCSSREGAGRRGEQPAALPCKRTEHAWHGVYPAGHYPVKLSEVSASAKSLRWKNKAFLFFLYKSAAMGSVCKLEQVQKRGDIARMA